MIGQKRFAPESPKPPAELSRIIRYTLFAFDLGGTCQCSSPKLATAPASKNNHLDETDQIIDSLLGDMRRIESPTPAASAANPPAKQSSAADSFNDDRVRIRASVAQWDHGTGATLRFLKEATGEKLSLIFVDETAPIFKSDAGMWMIQSMARVTGGKIVGHFVLFLKDLKAGKYRGDDHTKEAVMGVLMGETSWDGQNPETAWSVNRESWCEVILRRLSDGGIEGDFRARLVDNKGSGFINIDSGYLFIKQ